MVDPKELFGNNYQEFCEVDPFNPKNKVEGYISRKPNEFYGSLIITKINDRAVTPQLIMGSPKMHYPFSPREDGSRDYKFPIVKNIEIWEKIDGSNVVAYQYSDGDNQYTTFKLRLRPFMANSRFGKFLDMWKEVASDYFTEIEREMERSNCNLSFEIFGSRNPHLIIYKNSLNFALLFGVTNDGKILSPTELRNPDLPIAVKIKSIDKDFVQNYEQLQIEFQDKLQQDEEGYYSGMEGCVWYAHTPDGGCTQFKMKPEVIEAIHFSQGGAGLSKTVILATTWNALENTDSPTIEFVSQLLLEEFDAHAIEANEHLIGRCITFVIGEAEFRNKVSTEYKATGLNILLNKTDVMRQLSTKFERNQMKKVYSVIRGTT